MEHKLTAWDLSEALGRLEISENQIPEEESPRVQAMSIAEQVERMGYLANAQERLVARLKKMRVR